MTKAASDLATAAPTYHLNSDLRSNSIMRILTFSGVHCDIAAADVILNASTESD